ncbi:MAG: redoxin domain-containing protein [Phycisphaerae bacterium]|nr:redoxin domain-containing protein [Phycisphaerae bacterium]MBT6268886.1 redoxin domain-containing protein [Phycisphaerae bacterium]MBT6281944.1 redoxin domain-containing protein [Phycisphaerae bacterium]
MPRTIKTILSISSLLFLAAATQPTPPPRPDAPANKPENKKVAEIGEPAPSFALKDQHGKTHTLKEYEGKIVVLEWFTETCPYCRKSWTTGLVPKLIKDLDGLDKEIVYIAVNSSTNGTELEIIKGGKEFIEELELSTTLLIDYDGTVGRAYGAKTTPHMFVIDAEGVLVFQGAFSDDKRFKNGEDAEIYALTAIKQLIADEAVSPSYVQPWGCPVKYGKGKPGRGGRKGPPSNGPSF